MKRILVVDPSSMMRRNLVMVLQHEGYDLVLAENGSEAFHQALKTLPDLILSEMALPELSGPQLFDCLKDYPLTAEIPILAMGTDENAKVLQQALDSGAVEYLIKPIDSLHLAARIAYYLQPFLTKGDMVTLDPLGAPPRLCQIEEIEGKSMWLGTVDGLPVRIASGDEVEVSFQDERDRSVYRQRAFVHTVEETLALGLVGGLYRTQRRKFFRKEIHLPLRYRMEGDFYRIGQAEDVGGGGLRIKNVISTAQVGSSLQVELRLPGQPSPLSIEGEVVRAKPEEAGVEIALSFRKIEPADQSNLVLFLFGERLGEG